MSLLQIGGTKHCLFCSIHFDTFNITASDAILLTDSLDLDLIPSTGAVDDVHIMWSIVR